MWSQTDNLQSFIKSKQTHFEEYTAHRETSTQFNSLLYFFNASLV